MPRHHVTTLISATRTQDTGAAAGASSSKSDASVGQSNASASDDDVRGNNTWHALGITHAACDPTAQRIAIATGTSKLFFWSADSAMCVDVPAEGFAANSLAWCAQADGAQAIVLNDASPGAAKQASSNHFCVVYFSEQ